MAGPLLIPAVPIQAAPKPAPKVLTACAAFSNEGATAQITVERGTILLEVQSLAKPSYKLKLPLRQQVLEENPGGIPLRDHFRCAVFFDRSGGLVAVGIERKLALIQIGVADVHQGHWIGDFVVPEQPDFKPWKLLGFLDATTNLVVDTVAPFGKSYGRHGVLLFAPQGRQLTPAPNWSPFPVNPAFGQFNYWHGPELSYTLNYVDIANNRLWTMRCSPQSVCRLLWTNLVGDRLEVSEFNPANSGGVRRDLWSNPNAIVALDTKTILILESKQMWRLDVERRSIESTKLPPGLPSNATLDMAVSPDRLVLAFPQEHWRLAFPWLVDNYVNEGTNIITLQLGPAQRLKILPHGKAHYTPGIAVDHRDGKIIVLAYRDDHWERSEFKDASK